MFQQQYAQKIVEITEKLRSSELKRYIDDTGLSAPLPFRGSGPIKLIILGQDPTVRSMKHRQEIKVTLLLDKPGRLPNYLRDVCGKLGLDFERNLYATNILKNFFIDRPDQLAKKEYPGLIQQAFAYWRNFLLEELSEFKDLPVITLGEPVVNCLSVSPVLIRDFWGFQGPACYDGEMKHILPNENILHSHIFPFPHIHGFGHKIYRNGLSRYTSYMVSKLGW